MFRPLVILSIFILLACIGIRCAQVAAPVGGEKDEEAPDFVKADPPMGATEVTPKKIRIYFDEFIKLQAIRKNVLFSPPIQGYEVIRRKRSIEVKIPKDSLKPRTTHTIQFGDAIKDITEGNTTTGFSYVFSTGEHVDSLELKGRVVDAFSRDTVSDASILVYRAKDSADFRNDRPFYYTQVDGTGQFAFEHLKKGDYELFALKDLNNNLQFDPGEAVAFLKQNLTLKRDTNVGALEMFQQKVENAGILKTGNAFKGKFKVTFNHPIDTFRIIKGSHKPYYWYGQGKTGKIFYAPTKSDSVGFDLLIDKKEKDIAYSLRDGEFLDQLKADTNFSVSLSNRPLAPDSGVWYYANHPLQTVTDSLVRVLKDSVLLEGFNVKIQGKNDNLLKVSGDFKPDSSYKIVLDSNALTDLYGNSSPSIDNKISIGKKSDFGLLGMTVNRRDTMLRGERQFIVQLIKEKSVVREKITNNFNDEVVFKVLPPGSYQIRVIVDQNQNGFWDEGNAFQKLLPEPVVILDKSIKVKSNWEMRKIEVPID